MKIKDLFEAEEKSLVGMTIEGKKLPVKGKWEGRFSCIGKKLTSLEGAPSSVEGDFACAHNDLTSLKGAPTSVSGSFLCYDNKLTSLKGAPNKVGGNFYCYYNQLTSLEGAPSSVGGYFTCYNNKLTSLKGAPTEVGGKFHCHNNQLTSLKGAPSSVGGKFYAINNELESLKDVHRQIKKIGGEFECSGNPIKSHVLGLLLIDGLTEVKGDQSWVPILNQAIEQFDDKRKRVMWAQAELIKQLGEEGKALAQL
jgi:hypothetical protein